MNKHLLLLFTVLWGCVSLAWADASGTCGTNLNWSLNSSTHTLTITGTGAMTDFGEYNAPWYANRAEIYTVSLPNGMTHIGNGAFFLLNNLTTIQIPGTVTGIGNRAFQGCSALTSMIVPEGVTSIGDFAFLNCNHITTLSLPSTLTNIAQYAFQLCTALEDVSVHWTSLGSVTVSSYNPFHVVTTSNVRLHVPLGTRSIYAATSPWSGFNIVEQVLPGKFSISATKQICFSVGNLQYQASSSYWRFAEHQYDYVGNTSVGTVSEGGVKCSNTNISSSYSGWIDLFGWATSGNSASGTQYLPYATSMTNSEYGPDITSGEWTAANSDWGVVNATQLGSGWRTLSSSEWNYLLSSRTNAANLRTLATVCDVKGMILLPDGWTASGVTLSIITTDFTTNTINASDWATLESQGSVFLPGGGYRTNGNGIFDAGNRGLYWTSSVQNADEALYLDFRTTPFVGIANRGRHHGYSVRLSHELPAASVTSAPTAKTGLVYTGSAQTLVNAGTSSTGTMYYSLNNSTWSAEIPTATDAGSYTVYYRVVGDANHSDYTPSPNSVPVTIADFSGSGTEGDPYLIPSMAVWNHLRDKVNAGTNYSDKYFRQTADISVTTMIGTSSHMFSGTYDGADHTLTVTYSSSAQYAAPFSYANVATFKNLRVAGTITTSAKYGAGFIGWSAGATTFVNCRSSVTINSSVNGDGTHGGYIGILENPSTAHNITFEGCIFDGEMIGSNTTCWGGFVGWSQVGNIRIHLTNCLFAPSVMTVKNNSDSRTFSRGDPESSIFGSITNSYYTQQLGNAQAKQAYSITGASGITVTNAGTPTVYDISGITGYGTGIKYNGVFYGGNGDAVSLNLSGSSTGYYSSSSGTVSGSSNPYSLSIGSADAVIYASSMMLTAPSVIAGLVYDGTAHALITAGTATGGTMVYSLDNSSWSSVIPTGIHAGVHTVYYKVEGTAPHVDYIPSPNTLQVQIAYETQPACATVAVDELSFYIPTSIVNGSFNNAVNVINPPAGVDEGWNSTETDLGWGAIERSSSMSTYNSYLDASTVPFIDLNSSNRAVISQDMTTHGRDIIKWSLMHAVRKDGALPQSFSVEIGAPERDGSNNIILPEGINAEINPHIIASTMSKYSSTGVTGYNGYNDASLQYMALDASNQYQWYTVSSVYSVPVDQTVTRLALMDDKEIPAGGGSLLDEITFSTLLGNFSAGRMSNNDVEIHGYWGETNSSKKLIVEIGSHAYGINMSGYTGQNFVITIPHDCISESYTTVTGYHEDYPEATVTVDVIVKQPLPSSVVITPPNPVEGLTENKYFHTLVTAGSATEGYTMVYALGTDGVSAPTSGWTTSIPQGKQEGDYYVWYKVLGGLNYNNTDPAYVVTHIGPTVYRTVNTAVQEPGMGSVRITSTSATSIQIINGEDVELTAIPADEVYFRFVNWTDESQNVLGTNPNLTYTVTRDITITANFVSTSASVDGTIEGALSKVFSVSEDRRIYFASGNLQYQASTDTYQFAAHQYEAIGSDNSNVSPTYDGWIDYFGWGTGDQPTQTSEDATVYLSFVDWGVNPISNGGNVANLWRTLSYQEWNYIINNRPNASSKRGRATINGMYCYVLLPDDWTLPDGLSFSANTSGWTDNIYTTEQWAQMEAAGAVCLPAAGTRAGGTYNTNINNYNDWGCYWSNTSANSTQAYNLYFTSNHIGATDIGNYKMGASVRLVTAINTPMAKDMTYNGAYQNLIIAPGTILMEYKLNDGAWSTTVPQAKDAGTYTITCRKIGETDETVLISSIRKVPLTIQADNKQIDYGAAAPVYTTTCTGFVGGENISSLHGTLVMTCSYAAGDAKGAYIIIPSGVQSNNYDITFVPGVLKVGESGSSSGAGSGLFSVSGSLKVAFSMGNLQYQASTHTWRFAPHQYDIIGNAPGNNTSYDRDTQSAWIDLFGWGTSGYDGKYPWQNSNNTSDYAPTSSGNFPDNYDWGYYNSTQLGTGWRTLTRDEWEYLFNSRPNYADLCTKGTINGTCGLIVLPDDWTLPSGSSMTITTSDYTTNSYDTEEWTALENAGAVFLPAAGHRLAYSTSVSSVNSYGRYWSSTAYSSLSAYRAYFTSDNTPTGTGTNSRYYALSVRLVSTTPRASLTSAPTAKTNLTYDGTPQTLINAGTASHGTMQYQLGNGSWSTSLPQATYPGYYAVSYKVVGDTGYEDCIPTNNTLLVHIGIDPTMNGATIDAWTSSTMVVRTASQNLTGKTATIYTNGTQRATSLSLDSIDAGIWSVPVSLNAYAGQELLVAFYDGSTLVSVIDTVVPYIVSTDVTLSETSVPSGTDVQVISGILTVDDDATIGALDIYPGAKVVVESSTDLSVSCLSMRADGINNRYPQLVANGNITNANSDSIYYDYTMDYKMYYPLAVPYDVLCSAIRTRSGKVASFEVQWYNSEDRAANVSGWTVLDDQAPGATLHAGQGYIVYGVPYKWNGTRQNTTTIRFPMKADLTSGEQAKTVPIHLYGNAGTNASNRNWNFIANPYLATYQHDEDDELLQTDMYIEDMSIQGPEVSYTTNGDGLRYVTYSKNGYRSYTQDLIENTELLPFHGYFVQAAAEGNLIFDIDSRAQQAPRRQRSQNPTSDELALGIVLRSTDAADRTGLLYGADFTEAYELNADLVKMFGSAQGLSVYSIAGSEERAFNALALTDANRDVPIGFRNAPPGELTFAFDSEHYDASPFEAVMLTDREQNVTVNLLNEDYTFTTAETQNDARFALHAVLAPQTPTGLDQSAMSNLQSPIDGVYDVLGRPVTSRNLPAGIYIIIENGQSRKEVRQ